MGSNGGRNWLIRCPRAFSEPRLRVSTAARNFPFLALLSDPPLPPPRRGAYGSPTASLPYGRMALSSPSPRSTPPYIWTTAVDVDGACRTTLYAHTQRDLQLPKQFAQKELCWPQPTAAKVCLRMACGCVLLQPGQKGEL